MRENNSLLKKSENSFEKITASPQPDSELLKKFVEICTNAMIKIINEVLEQNTSVVWDAINKLNNIVLNFMAKIRNEPFEERKRKYSMSK